MSSRIDLSGFTKLVKTLKQEDNSAVEVGFFPESTYGSDNDNLPVAQVAYFNEYGTTLNPTRPFMADTFEDKSLKGDMEDVVRDVVKSALQGRKSKALDKMGEKVADLMKTNIEDYPGSNSKATIERKGKNDPLVDTGLMKDSVKSKRRIKQ